MIKQILSIFIVTLLTLNLVLAASSTTTTHFTLIEEQEPEPEKECQRNSQPNYFESIPVTQSGNQETIIHRTTQKQNQKTIQKTKQSNINFYNIILILLSLILLIIILLILVLRK